VAAHRYAYIAVRALGLCGRFQTPEAGA
jgi:hypothetical protein